MVRVISFIVLMLISVSVQAKEATPENEISYVCTIEPLSAIVQEIGGDRAKVETLLPSGASPHTYEPRPSDLKTAERATALIHISHAFDGWAGKLPVENKIAVLKFIPHELLLKMGEHAHHHGDAHEAEEGGVDAHFWTDPMAVKAMLPGLANAMCKVDAKGCKTYSSNRARFEKKLDKLHATLAAMTQPLKGKPILFIYPFLRYFLKRYNFGHVMVAVDVPGKNPSPKRMKTVIKQALKWKVKSLYSMTQLSDRPAQIIAESTGARIVILDPLRVQSDYESLVLNIAEKMLAGLK